LQDLAQPVRSRGIDREVELIRVVSYRIPVRTCNETMDRSARMIAAIAKPPWRSGLAQDQTEDVALTAVEEDGDAIQFVRDFALFSRIGTRTLSEVKRCIQ